MAHKAGYGATGIQGSTLQINVVGCRHLADKEWFSRQDPYVVIEYGSSRLRTRTDTDGGKNPSFNEKFSIPLIEGLREFTVQVWNSNTISLDDFIGSARVLLEKVLSTGYDDTAWALKSKHGKTAGEVNLILHYANTKKEDKRGAVGHQGAYPSAAGYPPSAFPPAYGAPAGYPPAHGVAAAYPPAHGAPAGYPPAHGAPAGYPPAFPPAAHGGHTGYPPAHGAPSSYGAAPAPGYPPSQSYPAGPSGYPPAGGYPPSAPGYPPPQSSHAAPYPAPGYPPHAPSGHYPAPAGYPSAHAQHAPGPLYGVPPDQFGKHGNVHVGSSGHYKHGKHKKHKGVKFFGKKFKGWKGKGWRGKK